MKIILRSLLFIYMALLAGGGAVSAHPQKGGAVKSFTRAQNKIAHAADAELACGESAGLQHLVLIEPEEVHRQSFLKKRLRIDDFSSPLLFLQPHTGVSLPGGYVTGSCHKELKISERYLVFRVFRV